MSIDLFTRHSEFDRDFELHSIVYTFNRARYFVFYKDKYSDNCIFIDVYYAWRQYVLSIQGCMLDAIDVLVNDHKWVKKDKRIKTEVTRRLWFPFIIKANGWNEVTNMNINLSKVCLETLDKSPEEVKKIMEQDQFLRLTLQMQSFKF